MNHNQPYNTTAVFTAACIGMCFFGVSMIALGALMTSLTTSIGLDGPQMASLATLLPVGMLAGSLIFGPVVDRFGHKFMLLGNCLLVLAGLLGVAFASSATALQCSVIAIGFGGGVLNGETNALVADIYDGNRRASRLSFLGVFYGLGALTIPLLLASLEESFSYTAILSGIAVAMGVGILACMFMRFPAPKQPQGFPLKDATKVITNPVMLILAFILFFQSGTEGITNNWTTSYLSNRGFDAATGQLALSAMLVGLTAARLLQGILFTRLDVKRVLCLSLGIAVAGYAVLLAAPGALSIAAAMTLVGAGLAATFPVILGILGEKFAALSGTAFSVALVVALCGQTALNYITGCVADGPGVSYFPWLPITAVAAMLVLFCSYAAYASRKKLSNS
ncbi:MAG: MFS transporter [Odoribacter sp.]|nr:MFS transporter [Odoribacter sp.]